MKYYIALIVFHISSVAIAQVPMLDSSTIKMPKSKTLNKCVDANNKIIYTQFECNDSAQKVEENWIDQTNITFSTAPKVDARQKGLSSQNGGNGKDKSINTNQSGLDILQEGMKDKSMMELFDQGIKALMMRQDMLDSI